MSLVRSKNARGLIYGVGINDADYVTAPVVLGKQKVCPFYIRWKSMLARCYSEKYKVNQPTYTGCVACPEWHLFSNFRSWMIQQDWEGNHLDKDILYTGNKLYSPETCVFVSKEVNLFITDSRKTRGEFLIGACWDKGMNKFVSQCWNPIKKRQERFGYFDTQEEAHNAWIGAKIKFAKLLAEKQDDIRVGYAIVARYENFKNTRS